MQVKSLINHYLLKLTLLFYRNVNETLYNSKNKEHQEKIRTAPQRLKEQIILANATQKHKAFKAVLALVFESDRHSIEYLFSA
jgi:hypothetical protein